MLFPKYLLAQQTATASEQNASLAILTEEVWQHSGPTGKESQKQAEQAHLAGGGTPPADAPGHTMPEAAAASSMATAAAVVKPAVEGAAVAKHTLADHIALTNHTAVAEHPQQPPHTAKHSPLLLMIWIIVTACIAINYLLYQTTERASLFGLAASLGILSVLTPNNGLLCIHSPPLAAILLILCITTIYYLCRIAGLWLAHNPHHDASADRILALTRYGLIICVLTIAAAIAIAPNLLRLHAPDITILLGIALGILLLVCARSARPLNAQILLLMSAALVLFLLLLTLSVPLGVSTATIVHVNHACALVIIALLALATATRNRQMRLQEDRHYSRTVSALEQQSRDLRTSLLELSGRLQTDKNNRNRMLRLLGHDLRSPIASLQTFASIITEKRGEITAEEINAIAHEIHRTCSLQLELLHNLLSLSSGSAPGVPPKPGLLELNSLVMRAWNNVADLAYRKQITLIRNLDNQQRVYIDPDALQTILRNIFANSIKFSHPGSPIRLCVEPHGESHIHLKIEDEGIGISKERLNRLFDEDFYSTRGTQGEKGIGIGLKLCLDLANANDCTLQLTSTPGKGTTATLTIPVSQSHAAAAHSPNAKTPDAARVTPL